MKTILALMLASFLCSGTAESGSPDVIWFKNQVPTPEMPHCYAGKRRPAQDWMRMSLPIGNGSIGASVMSSASLERIVLNEKTLWFGGPAVSEDPDYYWNVNRESHHLLPEIRQAFLDGRKEYADSLTRTNFTGLAHYKPEEEKVHRFGHYTTAGEIWISTGIANDEVSDFKRLLTLDSAYAAVTFRHKGTEYARKSFVSYPDNVYCLEFSTGDGREQNLTFEYFPNPHLNGEFVKVADDELMFNAHLDANGMAYAFRVKVVADDMDIDLKDAARFSVKADGAIVFMITADTDYKISYDPDFKDPHAYVGTDPVKTTASWIRKAARKGYSGIYDSHVQDYQNLYDRVEFTLNDSEISEVSKMDMTERMKRYQKGGKDYDLESLVFLYGRYLLIASSRPGNLPANLQGIWHNDVEGPWNVDYHNNINIQMNYWPACLTDLNECEEPYFDYIKTQVKPGERTAKAYYNARGWTASISANPFGFTAPQSKEMMGWNLIPVAGPWLCIDIWNYYDFTRDEKFLKDYAYDLIKESARFVVDYLWKNPEGHYAACPSTSPEHGNVDCGTTFAHAVCRELLDDAVKASEVLGRDAEEREEWKEVRDLIVPYKIGRYGQLLEWSEDIDDPEDEHRHVNHLFGLHPGNTISPVLTPELAEASKVVLNHRGDRATGWSMGWKLNQWARLLDGNRSYTLYRNLIRHGLADNLLNVGQNFQIDGNFGGTAGVVEMLLQSHAGLIHLLPSLPDAWKSGHVSGLIARGNFAVSIDWKDNRLSQAVVHSRAGQDCCILYGEERISFSTEKGASYKVRRNPEGKLEVLRLTRDKGRIH